MKKRVVQTEIIKKYSAKNRKKDIGTIHKYSKEWRLFAHRLGKQFFFRKFKLMQQNFICPVCEKILIHNKILHHIDYDLVCYRFLDNHNFSKKPECDKCQIQTPLYFHICCEKTVLLYHHCHGKLHSKFFLNVDKT